MWTNEMFAHLEDRARRILKLIKNEDFLGITSNLQSVAFSTIIVKNGESSLG